MAANAESGARRSSAGDTVSSCGDLEADCMRAILEADEAVAKERKRNEEWQQQKEQRERALRDSSQQGAAADVLGSGLQPRQETVQQDPSQSMSHSIMQEQRAETVPISPAPGRGLTVSSAELTVPKASGDVVSLRQAVADVLQLSPLEALPQEDSEPKDTSRRTSGSELRQHSLQSLLPVRTSSGGVRDKLQRMVARGSVGEWQESEGSENEDAADGNKDDPKRSRRSSAAPAPLDISGLTMPAAPEVMGPTAPAATEHAGGDGAADGHLADSGIEEEICVFCCGDIATERHNLELCVPVGTPAATLRQLFAAALADEAAALGLPEAAAEWEAGCEVLVWAADGLCWLPLPDGVGLRNGAQVFCTPQQQQPSALHLGAGVLAQSGPLTVSTNTEHHAEVLPTPGTAVSDTPALAQPSARQPRASPEPPQRPPSPAIAARGASAASDDTGGLRLPRLQPSLPRATHAERSGSPGLTEPVSQGRRSPTRRPLGPHPGMQRLQTPLDCTLRTKQRGSRSPSRSPRLDPCSEHDLRAHTLASVAVSSVTPTEDLDLNRELTDEFPRPRSPRQVGMRVVDTLRTCSLRASYRLSSASASPPNSRGLTRPMDVLRVSADRSDASSSSTAVEEAAVQLHAYARVITQQQQYIERLQRTLGAAPEVMPLPDTGSPAAGSPQRWYALSPAGQCGAASPIAQEDAHETADDGGCAVVEQAAALSAAVRTVRPADGDAAASPPRLPPALPYTTAEADLAALREMADAAVSRPSPPPTPPDCADSDEVIPEAEVARAVTAGRPTASVPPPPPLPCYLRVANPRSCSLSGATHLYRPRVLRADTAARALLVELPPQRDGSPRSASGRETERSLAFRQLARFARLTDPGDPLCGVGGAFFVSSATGTAWVFLDARSGATGTDGGDDNVSQWIRYFEANHPHVDTAAGGPPPPAG
eukprot:TRINITY_DN16813_c0_g1_i1.p1 TRINITY_DN16813_c0_g1~~TRINITY_DN16813_c0_g1_i1.p1  ORF type:complete len:973 (+),score=104.24 TRINITY_DN16813_c0_g1_i1:98-2920(+)